MANTWWIWQCNTVYTGVDQPLTSGMRQTYGVRYWFSYHAVIRQNQVVVELAHPVAHHESHIRLRRPNSGGPFQYPQHPSVVWV